MLTIKKNNIEYCSVSSSDQISYDNTNSTLESTNLKNTIDELSNIENEFIQSLDECAQSVIDGKTLLTDTLTSMGKELSYNETFSTIADTISQITVGTNTMDATATADKIVTGYTAYVNNQKVVGNATDVATSLSGTFTQSIYSDSTWIRKVIFSKPFATVPTVTCVTTTGSTSKHKLTLSDINLTGFTCSYTRTEYGTDSSVVFEWTATT